MKRDGAGQSGRTRLLADEPLRVSSVVLEVRHMQCSTCRERKLIEVAVMRYGNGRDTIGPAVCNDCKRKPHRTK